MSYKIYILILFLQLIQPAVFSQAGKFNRPEHFNDLHTIYTYQKSNWDGSHASVIFLYVKDTNRLVSFKWNKGDEWATIVSAEIDWTTFSVKKFTNNRIFRDGSKRKIAELEATVPGKLQIRVGDYRDSLTLLNTHWHSYDFDFAGLGFTWRALKNKQASFSFLIADAYSRDNKNGFENKGYVQVNYTGMELVNGKNCFKYSVDGPGLQNRGGHIWINRETNMIELYKIQLPDEDGFVNGQLKLLKTEKISPAEWEKFIQDKMQGK
jgi:hypothetical protein